MPARLAILYLSIWLLACGVSKAECTAGNAGNNWDLPTLYPADSFHVRNLETFAEEVTKATDGRLSIRVLSDNELGVAGTELVALICMGYVPISDVSLRLSSGTVSMLDVEGQPFLIRSYEELAIFYEVFLPKAQEALGKWSQRILTITPWPPNYLFLRSPLVEHGSRKIPIRTSQPRETDTFSRAGFNAIEMRWQQVEPSLAKSAIEGVSTPVSSASESEIINSLTVMYPTHHLWHSQALIVNTKALAKLHPADRAAVLAVAERLQPVFLERSRLEGEAKRAELVASGFRVGELPDELRERLERSGEESNRDYLAITPEARAIIEAFRERVGR